MNLFKKKIRVKKLLSIRGGQTETMTFMDDQTFLNDCEYTNFELRKKEFPRMTAKEVNDLYKSKAKLTSNQKLVKSVLEKAGPIGVSEEAFEKLKVDYLFRKKYKNYLIVKRILPFWVVSPFLHDELTKMAYSAAIGSTSVPLTLSGVIACSLPAFFFFHMSYYYAPKALKPAFKLGKYLLGAPFVILCTSLDKCSEIAEEKFFHEIVPIDITSTGGTIPSDLGNIDNLKDVLKSMENFKLDQMS